MLTLAVLVAVAAAQALPAQVTQSVSAEIVVQAAPDVVWRAWTTRAALEAWQVAKATDVELRVGARWRTSYDTASSLDDPSVIENEVLAFDPGRMLAVRTVRAPADFPFRRAILEVFSVLYLEPIDAGRTRVVVRTLGFTSDPESQKLKEFLDRGNASELQKLAAYLQK